MFPYNKKRCAQLYYIVLESRLSIAKNKLILLKREVNVKDTETSLTPRTRNDTENWNVRSSLFLSTI